MNENKGKKKNRLILFEIVVSVLFSDEKARKISETTKLGKKYRIIICLLLFLALFFWFIISSIIGDAQNKVRDFFFSPDEIEFSQNDHLKVLILPFHDSNDSNSKFKIEEVIENGLSEEKENYDLQIEIKIDSLSSTPKNFNDALKIGNEKKADFVIFGDLDSESKEYRINFVLTKDFYEFDVPIFLQNKHISEFKKNLKLSKIRSLESLKDEKFIIYNILGFSELKNGHCAKGIELLNKAIKLTNELKNLEFSSEDNSYYAYYMSECYLEKQEFENALPILDFSLKIYPNNYDSRIAKSVVHLLLGEIDKSKSEIDFLKTTDYYDKSSLYLASGFINLIKDNPELAYDEFDKSILLDNNDSIPSIAGGIVNILKGNFTEAIESTNKLTEYYDFEQPMSNGVKSFIHFFDGNLQKTLNELNLLEKNIKNSKSDINFDNFRKGIERGYKLGAGENYNESEIDSTYNSISRMISKDANQNIEDALKMMILMKNKSDFKMISKHLKSAINNNPEYATHYNLNNLKQEKVIELKKIIKNNKNIIKSDKTNYSALANISNAYSQLGYTLISDYYSIKAIRIDKRAFLSLLPKSELENNELSEIRQNIMIQDSILEDNNLDVEAYRKKSRLLTKLGFYKYAKTEAYKALDINPNHYNSIHQLGYIAYLESDFDKALEYDNLMIYLQPKNYNGYFNRGAMYNNMEMYEEALEDLNNAIIYYKGTDTTEIKRMQKFKSNLLKKTTPNTVYN